MKKTYKKIIILFLLSIISVFVVCCHANVEPQFFRVQYTASFGGYITGQTIQTIAKGADGEEIEAVANEGYRFTSWSDGNTSAKRKDKDINSEYNLTASFESLYLEISYSTGEGGVIVGEKLQSVKYGNDGAEVIAVPNAGFIFDKWSDGFLEPNRIDCAQENIAYTVYFKKVFDGSGTIADPYQIDSYQSLVYMKYYPEANYKIIKDIDLSGFDYEPVFNQILRFDGNFDGNYKTISNLNVNSKTSFPSLFGFIGSGSVKNLKIVDAFIKVPDYTTDLGLMCVGILSSVSHGELSNINVSGEIFSKSALANESIAIGGIVGWQTKKMENCHSDIVINAIEVLPVKNSETLRIGGLIGIVENDVLSCSAIGKIYITSTFNIEQTIHVGGLIGTHIYTGNGADKINLLNSSTDVLIESNISILCGGFFGHVNQPKVTFYISDCYAEGDILIKSDTDFQGYAGGFLGFFWVGANSVVENCHASNNVSAKFASGFAYDITNELLSILITGCSSSGNIFAGSGGSGFATGISGIVFNSYTTSNVSSNGDADGFICSFYGAMKRCYASGDMFAMERASGFIFLAAGNIEECFSSGNVEAGQIGCGFVDAGPFNLLNCYSTSNVSLFSDGYLAYGFIGGTTGIVENCYYSGKITFENVNAIEEGSINIFAFNVKGEIKNCHWLYDESNGLENPIGWDAGLITCDLTRYDNVEEMYSLANVLNGEEYDVWINFTSDDNIIKRTPDFRKIS